MGGARVGAPQRSVYIRELLQLCVVPQVFQVVVFACFFQEHVYHDRTVVQCYPFGILPSTNGSGLFPCLLAGKFLHRIGNRIDLLGLTACTDDKIGARCGLDALQVDGDYAASFLFVNPFNDCIYQLLSGCHF